MKLYIGGAYQGQVELAGRENPGAVIAANEVGAGVVPLLAEDRAFREAVGRALCVIAQEAEQVTRCVCGIGVRIK